MRLAGLRRPVAGLAAAMLLLSATLALAASGKPVKGATYAGTITRVLHANGHTFKTPFPIKFKVSNSGKRVGNFVFSNGYPVYCQGGGFGSPQAGSGKISQKGTFRVKLPLYFAPGHAHQGFLIVNGRFGKHRDASGTVTTDFTQAKICNGKAKFSAKAP